MCTNLHALGDTTLSLLYLITYGNDLLLFLFIFSSSLFRLGTEDRYSSFQLGSGLETFSITKFTFSNHVRCVCCSTTDEFKCLFDFHSIVNFNCSL